MAMVVMISLMVLLYNCINGDIYGLIEWSPLGIWNTSEHNGGPCHFRWTNIIIIIVVIIIIIGQPFFLMSYTRWWVGGWGPLFRNFKSTVF